VKRLLLCACLFCAACAGAGDKVAGGPVKYQAWCHTESKPLGDWHEDKKLAEEQRAKHERLFPFHQVRIWTGNPK